MRESSGRKLILPTAAACSIKLSADPYARSRWPAWICVAFGITVCVSHLPASKTSMRRADDFLNRYSRRRCHCGKPAPSRTRSARYNQAVSHALVASCFACLRQVRIEARRGHHTHSRQVPRQDIDIITVGLRDRPAVFGERLQMHERRCQVGEMAREGEITARCWMGDREEEMDRVACETTAV